MKWTSMALAAVWILATVAIGNANEDGNWLSDYPIALNMGNSSYFYFSNVISTEGWNITYEGGKNVAVEVQHLNSSWANGLNLTTGKVAQIAPMKNFDESYSFKDNGVLDLLAFKITDAGEGTIFATCFTNCGTVTAQGDTWAENQWINQSTVTNGTITLFGYWAIEQKNGAGPIIPRRVNVIGEYLIGGNPTGFATKDSSRPAEKEGIRQQIRDLQKKL